MNSSKLSTELGLLAEQFGGPRAAPAADPKAIRRQLVALRDLARLLEREVDVFRKLEHERARRGVLDQEAIAALEDVQKEGNVFRPNFRGRP